MQQRIFRLTVAAAIFLGASCATASKLAANRAYVQSGPGQFGDVFYARCIPDAAEGVAGRTEIYRVKAEGDEIVDRYDWFAPSGLILGWSPLKGKVAVLAMMHDRAAADWNDREALRISMAGQLLASYTNADLIAMGADETADSAHGLHAAYRVLGCEQIPGTNEYDFVLELPRGQQLRLDITTGRLRSATSASPGTAETGPDERK